MFLTQLREKMIAQGVDRIDVGDVDSVGVIDKPNEIPVFSDSTVVDLQVFLRRLGYPTTLDGWFGPETLKSVQSIFGSHWDGFYAVPDDAVATDITEHAAFDKEYPEPEPEPEPEEVYEKRVVVDWQDNITPVEEEEEEDAVTLEGVPFWSQGEESICDIKIGSLVDGDTGKPRSEEDLTTMQKDGCGVIAGAMALSYIKQSRDGSGELITPRQLNSYLQQNNGYYNNLLKWTALANYCQSHGMPLATFNEDRFRNEEPNNDGLFEKIARVLREEKVPVIARVQRVGKNALYGLHFLLVIGYRRKKDGKITLRFHDPGTWRGNAYNLTEEDGGRPNNTENLFNTYRVVGAGYVHEQI